MEDDKHASCQESEEAHDQNYRREDVGCRWTGLFPGGQRGCIHGPQCQRPAIRQYLAQSAVRTWRRGDGGRQPRHVPSLRQGNLWRRGSASSRMRWLWWLPWLRRRWRMRRLPRMWRRVCWRLPGLRLPRVRRLRGLRPWTRARARRPANRLRRLRGVRGLRRLLRVLGSLPSVQSFDVIRSAHLVIGLKRVPPWHHRGTLRSTSFRASKSRL